MGVCGDGVGDRVGVMMELEGRAEAVAATFNTQNVANTLWVYATMGLALGAGLMRVLEGRAEVLAGTFIAPNVANTLWVYEAMGRAPGARVMKELEGRTEAVAGTFNAQEMANTLWAACVFSVLLSPGHGFRWVHTVVQRLVSLGEAVCFNIENLCQIHQFFVSCSVEPRLNMEAINDMWALKKTCREAFECCKTAPSVTQQQVSETLRQIGMSVEDEVPCPNGTSSERERVRTSSQAGRQRGALC